jgi:hypothetical protein
VSAEIIEVPIQEVFPGENVRKALNARWLVDSIAELGILEPLKVYRNPAGQLTVLDGHRRLHAAKSAGLRTVKCIIDDDAPLEDDRILKQVVLNEAREGLSDSDQVAAAHQLALFNVPAERVAKLTGKDKQQFAKVITVASKDSTREIAVDCTLTLAHALKVAKAEDDGADMNYLAEHLEAEQREQFAKGEDLTDWQLDGVISHAISFPYVQAKRAELEAEGVKTLGEDDEVPEGAKALWELGLTAEQHEDCPHRLVKVAPVSWNLTNPHVSEYCADPEAAGHTLPSEDEYDEARHKAEREEAELLRQQEEERKRTATEYRREFIKRKLAQFNDGKIPKGLFVLAITGGLISQTIVDPALLEELGSKIGIRNVPQDKDECTKYLLEFANMSFIDSLRIFALVTLASFETRSQALFPNVEALRLYFETLEKWGHVLTPSECGLIGRLTNEDVAEDAK